MTDLPTPTNPAVSVRSIIAGGLGAIVETRRPNCTMGYVARNGFGWWTFVPDNLVAFFVPPPPLLPITAESSVSAKPTTKSPQPITRHRDPKYNDVECHCGTFTSVELTTTQINCRNRACGQMIIITH